MRAIMGLSRAWENVLGRRPARRSDAGSDSRWYPGVDWRWLTHSCWGPGGSVGFELATGKRTTIPRSDLDIVVYANEHLSRSDAQRLLVSTRGS